MARMKMDCILNLAVIKNYGDAFKGFRRKSALKKAIGAAIWHSGRQKKFTFFCMQDTTNTELELRSSNAKRQRQHLRGQHWAPE